MNLNIYIEDRLAQELAKKSQMLGKTRNALIRMAISEFLAHHALEQWPHAVRTFRGIPSFPAFEGYRCELKPPKEDPLE